MIRGLHLQSERPIRQYESRETEEALRLLNHHARTYMYTGANKILNCVYANARSKVSKEKRAELELIVGTENPDLIGIIET